MPSILPFEHILTIGGGAWGTALACLVSSTGTTSTIWSRNPQVVTDINTRHENALYLKDVSLPPTIKATSDLSYATDASALLFVAPAQSARAVLTDLRDITNAAALPVALCCKGIEQGSGALMSDVIAEVWPEAIPAVLSGPSFAADVSRGLPTAVTLACADPNSGASWVNSLQAPHFRPYLTDDIIGAELGGAVKNVLAIACGIVEGAGLGESAKAALMARGFAEFQRLGMAMGAKPQTMVGLSGLGDLILTCSSLQSRNMSLGYEIGKGSQARDILQNRHTVSEGAATAGPLIELAEKYGVEMPISGAVRDIVEATTPLSDAIAGLLSRPLKTES